jgi:hypothetical protein
MGTDLTALHRLWREKRGEAEPEDLSGNLTVQLGKVTEDLNRRWFETNSGHQVIDVQKHVRHPGLHWRAHYWARELTKLGHQVRLMPAKDVKAYVKRTRRASGSGASLG